METQDIEGTRAFMKTVNVLSDQGEVREAVAPVGEDRMRPVRLTGGYQLPTPVVPLPHQVGVASERVWGCEVLWAVGSPESVSASEGGDTARGRHSGSRQDGRALR